MCHVLNLTRKNTLLLLLFQLIIENNNNTFMKTRVSIETFLES